MAPIPRSEHAVIGGSGTAAIEFPEALDDPRIRVLDELSVRTPFGESPQVKLVALQLPDGGLRPTLMARMHGWQRGVDRGESVLALFWLFKQAGVRRVVGEAGTGSITQHFRPRDLIVPHDLMDFTAQVGGRLDPDHRVIMRAPFCPEIRSLLWENAQALAAERATRAFDRGVHATTQGTRFETAAEVGALARSGADLVGSGVSPEVSLAREIGACYGTLCIVLNYAEGVRPRWDYELLEEIVREDAQSLATCLVEAAVRLPQTPGCACASYRKRVASPAGATALTDTA